MAWARIIQRWPDRSETELEVGTDTAGYPDVMSEIVARVTDLWRETCQAEPADQPTVEQAGDD